MRYRKLKGYKYDLDDPELYKTDIDQFCRNRFIVLSGGGWLYMRKHYAWDGPSGPTFDTDTFMHGSLVHDALYQLMREGLLDRKWRKRADEILREICLEDGMAKWRAWYVYHSVRLFAEKSSMPRKKPRGEIVEI